MTTTSLGAATVLYARAASDALVQKQLASLYEAAERNHHMRVIDTCCDVGARPSALLKLLDRIETGQADVDLIVVECQTRVRRAFNRELMERLEAMGIAIIAFR